MLLKPLVLQHFRKKKLLCLQRRGATELKTAATATLFLKNAPFPCHSNFFRERNTEPACETTTNPLDRQNPIV